MMKHGIGATHVLAVLDKIGKHQILSKNNCLAQAGPNPTWREFSLFVECEGYFICAFDSRITILFPEDDAAIKASAMNAMNTIIEFANQGRGNLFVLTRQAGIGYSIAPIKYTQKFEDDFIETHYNDDFAQIDTAMRKAIEVNTKGILLLHGDPGAGKTTYVKYLASRSSATFIIIPKALDHATQDPDLFDILEQFSDVVLVVEDAEDVIAARDGHNNPSVAAMLNLADGLSSDVVPIRVICTFNCGIDEIDQAILRPGRLIAAYEFVKLDIQKTNALLAKRGKPKSNEPLTLAEIYCDPPITVRHLLAVGFQTKR
jgi:SpoVK/Ycf46/Vps4 family AAA+-type ATPase